MIGSMIGSLRGVVLERHEPGVVLIEAGGVGYRCTVTPRTLAELEPTVSVYLYCHHHVRDDAQQLFGFASRAERDTFELLITVHGVGPSLAMAILSVHAPAALADIVATSDLAALSAVSGVGKKTAERLVVELRDRFGGVLGAVGGGGPSGSSVAEVREALMTLGYSNEEVRETLASLGASQDSATLLREALVALGGSRA